MKMVNKIIFQDILNLDIHASILLSQSLNLQVFLGFEQPESLIQLCWRNIFGIFSIIIISIEKILNLILIKQILKKSLYRLTSLPYKLVCKDDLSQFQILIQYQIDDKTQIIHGLYLHIIVYSLSELVSQSLYHFLSYQTREHFFHLYFLHFSFIPNTPSVLLSVIF